MSAHYVVRDAALRSIHEKEKVEHKINVLPQEDNLHFFIFIQTILHTAAFQIHFKKKLITYGDIHFSSY